MSDEDEFKAALLQALGGANSEAGRNLAEALKRESDRRLAQPEEAEVLAWLAGNRRSSPLALNHFRTRGDAEGFVRDLYNAGAVQVIAANIAYHDAEEHGGPYTDTLRIELPEKTEDRAGVFALCNAHCMADSSTGTGFIDEGQRTLVLWWD